MAEVRYWVKNEFGRVWGPFGLPSVGRLDLGTGELVGRISISTDGRAFQPIAEHPDVLKAIEVTKANAPPPRRLVAEAKPAVVDEPPPPPQPSGPAVPTAPPPPVEDFSRPPESGEIEKYPLPHLCARVAAAARTGVLRLHVGEAAYAIHFKKGTPERIDVPRAAEELARFLGKRNAAPVSELQKALELSGGPDGELLDALMALNVVPMNDVFRHLGEHAVDLYGRVLLLSTGTFTWEEGKAPPAGSFALGQRWSLLCSHARKLPMTVVREQLGGRSRSAVYRSGAPLAKTEELALTAQETRVLATFDGTRSPELIAREMPGESDVALRLALMLSWFNIVSFGPELGVAAVPTGPVMVDELDAAVEKNTAHADPAAPTGASPEAALGKVALKSVAVKVNAPEGPKPPPAAAAPPVKVEPKPAPVVTPAPAKTPAAAVPAAKTAAAPPARTPSAVAPATAPAAKAPVAPAAPAKAPVAKAPPAKAAARPEPPKAPPPKVATAAYAKAPAKSADPLGDGRALLEKWKKANHFEVLGLPPTATGADVKAAYIALARIHHPDTVTGQDETALRELKAQLIARVNEANSVLGDDKARVQYANELASGDAEKVDIGPILQAEEEFLRATILVKARKYAEGLALLETAILMNPAEAEFYAWRGFSKFCLAKDKKAEYESAMADCQKAIRMNENVAQSHLFVGQMSKLVGEAQKAEKAFRRVIELDPKNVEAARELRLLASRG